jgi:bZIP factor
MKKCARPFKAISVRLGEPSAVSSEPYVLFRQRMLEQVKAISKSSGNKKRSPAVKRPSSPQPSSSSEGNPPDGKDAAYWERRKKNNEAAKRSRDARRAKEDELAIRTSFLERENWMLKYEVMRYRNCGFQLVPNNCVSNT